ncbi:hypothetical protein PHMEG_00035789, partial [Phytophthora megakarya]
KKIHTGKISKPSRNANPIQRGGSFKLFQQAREYGQFEALMDDDGKSESDVASDNESVDDAAYAFPPDVATSRDPGDGKDITGSPANSWQHSGPPSVAEAEYHRSTQRARCRQLNAAETEVETNEKTPGGVVEVPQEEGVQDVAMTYDCLTSMADAGAVASSAPNTTIMPADTLGLEIVSSSMASFSSDLRSDELA